MLRIRALLALIFGLMNRPCVAQDLHGADAWYLSAFRSYYRAHAHIVLEPEQRLSNGIAWRMHVDAVTGTKGPRITWMPDIKRQQIANMLLEGVQGDDLRAAMEMFDRRDAVHDTEGEYLQRLIDNKGKIVPKASTQHEIDAALTFLRQIQRHVDLTYASVHLVSTARVFSTDLSRPRFSPRGLTFDLARGSISHVTPCNDRPTSGRETNNDEHYFRFGSLLRICDEATFRAFRRVYVEQAILDARTLSARPKSPPETGPCLSQYIDLDKYLDRDDRFAFSQFAFYLTPNGLAAHRWFVNAGEPHECTFESSLNPTIIPYHKLAPLMEPGPWREELLALH